MEKQAHKLKTKYAKHLLLCFLLKPLVCQLDSKDVATSCINKTKSRSGGSFSQSWMHLTYFDLFKKKSNWLEANKPH